ncbi:MAG: integrase arm-type DNA-binding domain-containing protein [Pseudomonadota bacterium]
MAGRLTSAQCKSIAAPGRHGDGGGLYLVVKKSGRKNWVFLYKVDGRRREAGLGSFPDISLATARRAADEMRAARRAGVDPLEATARSEPATAAPTFADAADKLIAAMEPTWRNAKHRQQWHNTLSTYTAAIAEKSVDNITTDDVLSCLEPIWQSKPETAARLRGRIERVLDYAAVRGWRDRDVLNPAQWRGHLSHVLPARSKTTIRHRPAMPWRDVPAFVARVSSVAGNGAAAVIFTILTAARPGEARSAAWSEIDLVRALWTVPAHRMKAGLEHKVPMSPQAVALIERQPRVGDLVFPGARLRTPLSDMTLLKVVKVHGAESLTVHGFRSSFKDWCTDTGQSELLSEMCLAHVVGDASRRAYARTDAVDGRGCRRADDGRRLGSPQDGASVSHCPTDRHGQPRGSPY